MKETMRQRKGMKLEQVIKDDLEEDGWKQENAVDTKWQL